MEDDHPHLQLHHQQQDYGVPDLRQLMTNNGRTLFPGIPQAAAAADLFSGHHHHNHGNLTPQEGHYHHHHLHHYEMVMMPREFQEFNNSSAAVAGTNANNSTSNNTSVAATPSFSGFESEAAASFGGDVGNGRWPRQETLTLLEIRSRLNSKFKEANQKGPLWDEVSRIMSEEHGYQRSGKKCREKFENLYKYYKKTKEGKAGRQDGKHYRFFRQLEALYGDSTSNSVSVQEPHLLGTSSCLPFNHSTISNTTAINEASLYHHHQDQMTFPRSLHKLCDHHHHSLSLSNNPSEFNSSSSDDNDLSIMENGSMEKKRNKRNWKAKIKEFIDSQMRKLMEKQEAWLEKLTKTLEQKEQERVLREEEWRKQEQARIDREHKFWAKERAWIEARDAALMKTLQNFTGRKFKLQSPIDHHDQVQNNNTDNNIWTDSEITLLIELRSSLEARFQESGNNDSEEEEEEALWEEIGSKMICLGHEKNGLMCKEKWDQINHYMNKTKEGNKKRKENNSRSSCEFFQMISEGSLYTTSQGTAFENSRLQLNDSSSPGAASNSNNVVVGNSVSDSCFRFLMADGDHLWENYGLKLSNGENQ